MLLKKRNLFILLIVLLAALYYYFKPSLQAYFASKSYSVNHKEVVLFLDEGISLKELSEFLFHKKVIEDTTNFMVLAKHRNLKKKNIAAGKYLIKPKTNFKELVWGFSKNKEGNGNAELKVNVNIYNFKNIYKLAAHIEKCIKVDSAVLVELLISNETLELFNLNRKEELISIFFPKNYKMYFDSDEQDFLKNIKFEFDQFWTKNKLEKLNKMGLKSTAEVSTLASIVFSEQSKHANEWPIIAGLYLNRLKKNIPLQSDPTFKFCWGDQLKGVQDLTYKHRDIDCPYNTYYMKGLPPGPICISPSKVIDSVLNVKNVPWIFMMAQANYSGMHHFSITNAQHDIYRRKYKNWRNIEKLKKKNK